MKEKQHICINSINKRLNEILLFKFIICFKP